MVIIGISGKKESGKTTLAENLCVSLDMPGKNHTVIVSFADKLKALTAELIFNMPPWTDDMKKAEIYGKTGREWLQIIGTDWFRTANPQCWIHAYQQQLETYKDLEQTFEAENFYYIITPDVRFENEVEAIHNLGGVVIRLLRSPHADAHESETALDSNKNFDCIIDNSNLTVDLTFGQALAYLSKRGLI